MEEGLVVHVLENMEKVEAKYYCLRTPLHILIILIFPFSGELLLCVGCRRLVVEVGSRTMEVTHA